MYELRKNIGHQPAAVILDNAKIHTSRMSKSFLHDFYFTIYTVPYSPELNPIEEVFRLMKSYLYKKDLNSSDDIVEEALKFLQSVGKNHLLQYYMNSLKQLVRKVTEE